MGRLQLCFLHRAKKYDCVPDDPCIRGVSVGRYARSTVLQKRYMREQNGVEKPLLIQTARGFSVLYRNKYLYSKYHPEQALLAQVEGVQIPDSALLLCFSPVLGYGLKELAEKLPASSYILAVECDQMLMRFSLDHCDFSFFTGRRFSYVRTDSVAAVVKKIEALPLFPFKKCITLSCSGGVLLYRDFYDEVRRYAEEAISRFWRNRLTLMHFGRNYAHNTFRNLLFLTNDSRCRLLSGEERIAQPVLVAGAGPSLDGARDFICKNRDSFFLLAVDAAAAALLPDIRPDAAVLVESQYWIDSAFIGLQKQAIPVFADVTASPRAIRFSGGPVFFFCTDYAPLRYLRHLYRALQPLVIPPVGSVGLTAVQLALLLTDSHLPVFHTGLDFAWSGGLTHAAESSPVKKLFAEAERTKSFYTPNFPAGTERVIGKQGLSYWTTPVLTGYAELYRHTFAGNGRIIDIGGVGRRLTERQAGYAEAETLLAAATGGASATRFCSSFDGARESDAERGREGRQRICAYLAHEYEYLSALAAHLQGKHPLPEKMMERIIAGRDYLYSHFPDAARGYSLELGFLKRVSVELSYMLKALS